MDSPPPFMVYLWKRLRNWFFTMVWGCTVFLVSLGLFWMKKHDAELVPAVLLWVFIPAFLFYCAASFYILLATIHHLDADPALSIWGAIKRSYAGLRRLLTLLPVIGSLFEPDEDRTHYDPDDE